jgi:hypothetical protein
MFLLLVWFLFPEAILTPPAMLNASRTASSAAAIPQRRYKYTTQLIIRIKNKFNKQVLKQWHFGKKIELNLHKADSRYPVPALPQLTTSDW